MFHSFSFEQKINPEQVDLENHVLKRVQMCRTGETNDSRAIINKESVLQVFASASTEAGLKARFGHPQMCDSAVGSYLGRWKNPELETNEDGKTTCFGDLHLAESAAKSPKGDLRAYVEKLFLEKENDAAGASVVVELDEEKTDFDSEDITEWTFASVHACDIVDEPAATDGMFSKFSSDTMAGKVTEFLQNHPEIYDFAKDNPSIVESFLQKLGMKKKDTKSMEQLQEQLQEFLGNSLAEFEEKQNKRFEKFEEKAKSENEALGKKVEELEKQLSESGEAKETLSAEFEELKKAHEDLSAKFDTIDNNHGQELETTPEPKKKEKALMCFRK